MTNRKKKVGVTALYVRVSTDKQDSGAESQLRKIEEYCKYEKIKEYEVFMDKNISGAKSSRPQFDKMLKGVVEGRVDKVITYSLSRIGRSVRNLSELLEVFNGSGVTFISLSENIDTKTSTGRLVFNILASVAEFERETISERVRVGLDNARSKGVILGKPRQRDSKKIRRLYNKGETQRYIADFLECSLGSVQAEIKEIKEKG